MIVGVFHPSMSIESYGGSVAVTLSVVNTLSENGYNVVLYTRHRIDQQKLSRIMGEALSSKAKIILKSSILKPRSIINLYENAFKLLTLKLKCEIAIDTYSNYIFPWANVCYIHFPYINNFLFKQKFPYLKKRKGILNDAINLPYIFFEKNFEKYEEKLLLANSQFTSKAIKGSIGADAKILYPPVSASFLEALNIYGKEQRENIVVTVGRVTADKRLETIPVIANLLREKNIQFIIIGFLHDKKTLKKVNVEIEKFGLKEKIKILTDISKEELKKILGKAKVYLHPPTIEHFGISIAEAMAMGCIPVIYYVGGAKEYAPEEFVYKNLQEAAEKVEKAINSWSMREAKRMNKIVHNFSEINFRKNFLEIFTDYCSRIN